MDTLPCEILLGILSWLQRPNDLATSESVCAAWSEVASDDSLWYPILACRFPCYQTDVALLGLIHTDLRPRTAKATLRALATCAHCGRTPPLVPCGRQGKRMRVDEQSFGSAQHARVRLCGTCMRPGGEGAATKTEVKRRFLLDDGDLTALPFVARRNPYSIKKAPMTLYIVRMAQMAAARKYGSIEGIERALQRREAAASRRRATIACNRKRALEQDDGDDERKHGERSSAFEPPGVIALKGGRKRRRRPRNSSLFGDP